MLATKVQRQALICIFKKGTSLSYKKGELIIREGESPSGIFYIKSGFVKAYDITRYGEENLLSIRKEKEIFPIIWGLTAERWHVMYEAMTATEVYRVSQTDYIKEVRHNSDLMAPLLDITLQMYRFQSQRIINLEYRSARERLVSFLLITSERFGKKTKEGIKINAPLRQKDIAHSINTSRETASREISALERKGLIITNDFIVLTQIDKLRAIVGQY